MSTLILSILLLALVYVGWYMSRVNEGFDSPPSAPISLTLVLPEVSYASETLPTAPGKLNVNNVGREIDAAHSANIPCGSVPPPSTCDCPKATTDVSINGCPIQSTNGPAIRPMLPGACPSSDYIRKDEIPCWNCTLP
jgi:hypothetical protein